MREINWHSNICLKCISHLYVVLCLFTSTKKEIVEELALDIFLNIWANKNMPDIYHSIKAYLFQAARNKCLNELRKKKQTVSLDELKMEIADTYLMTLERDELYNLIQEAVSTLPDRCKEVFQLSRDENLTNKEIANKLDISVKTVEVQITKALRRLRESLGDAYFYLW